MPDRRQRLGLEIEAEVARRLERSGWFVLERRHRSVAGELDLICLDPSGTLVGIEVRARRSTRTGSAAESIGRPKVARLRRALAVYAADAGGRYGRLRVDLVTADRDPGGRWHLVRHPAVDAW